MEKKVCNDIISVLGRVIEILKVKEDKDIIELKELSNHTIHCASIYQDEDSISIAVLIYSIYKLLSREIDFKGLEMLKKARKLLKDNDVDKYKDVIRQIFEKISIADKSLKIYMQQVLKKARITKGSKLIEHGISVARAAELMGISQWELMSYLGKTNIVDREKGETELKKKFKFAKRLFSK